MPFITQGKTNWNFLLIVIILAAIVGGGVLWCASKQEVLLTEFPEIKIPEDETADWKTYRNEKYGFEFEYPGEFDEIRAQEIVVDEETTEGCVKGEAISLILNSSDPVHPGAVIPRFSISLVSADYEDLEFNSKDGTYCYPYYPPTVKEGIIIDSSFPLSSTFLRATGPIQDPSCSIFQEAELSIAEYNKKYSTFEISSSVATVPLLEEGQFENWETEAAKFVEMNINELASQMKQFDLIAKSIKFFTIDETADWQAYRNEEYGFEIKYPQRFNDYKGCELKEEETGIRLGGRIEIMVSDSQGLVLSEYVDKEISELSLDSTFKLEARETILINNNEAVKITHRSGGIGRYGEDVYLLKNNKIYQFSVFSGITCSGLEEEMQSKDISIFDFFNQMLSTFRFLEEERIKCISDEDCIIFGDESNANCGCFNKESQWQPIEVKVGESLRSVPIHCRCINGACGPVFKPTGESSEFDFVYIKKIYTKNEKEYLDIDYIEWVTCDGFRSECLGSDGYVIMNYEPEIKTFEIPSDVDIRMCSPSHYVIWDEKITYERFKELLEEHSYYIGGIPFHIKVQNDKIIKIEEQYIP